MVSTLGD